MNKHLSCWWLEMPWRPCGVSHILFLEPVTHWGRVTHICVGKLTIIGSDNGLSPARCQTIIWTNAGILLIRPSGTNISEILIEIGVFSFKKINLKMSSAKCRPFCHGLNVLTIFPMSAHTEIIAIHNISAHVLFFSQLNTQLGYPWPEHGFILSSFIADHRSLSAKGVADMWKINFLYIMLVMHTLKNKSQMGTTLTDAFLINAFKTLQHIRT